jgi:hypothetical protein
MKRSEISWTQATRIWWSIAWRTLLFSALAGAMVGGAAGAGLGATGHGDLAAPTGRVLGWLASVPVSIGVIRAVLRKDFADFSLRLVPHGGPRG